MWQPAPVVRLSKGENAYSCGQHDGSFYLIEEGQVKTTAYSRDGKRCLLSVYVEREAFGELGVVAPTRTETATAMASTALRRVPTARLAAALRDSDLAGSFALHLVSRLSQQQRVIANMVTLNSERRLAVVLLELARKVGSRQGTRLCIQQRITHEDLSAMVGTTRSRIGLFLRNFRDRGLLVPAEAAWFSVEEWRMERYVAME